MLTIQLLRDKSDFVIERLKVKQFDAHETVKRLLKFDNDSREIKVELESKNKEINDLSKEYGKLKHEGKENETSSIIERTLHVKKEIKNLTVKLKGKELKVQEYLLKLPNLPHASVPLGKTSEDNEEIRHGGIKPHEKRSIAPHWDLAAKYKLIDFELGNKITGANFPVYLDKGAILQRALINFFLEENRRAGYIEVLPPFIVNGDSGFGTGQLPDKEGQMYYVELDKFYLIPTAEVPVTNIYRDVILEETDLPIKNTAYTPCFRREAGSYGKDVRGLNRLHQFDKVEIVQIEHPDRSYQTLEEMVSHVEELVKKLQLKYRIMRLCGGDMGFTSALTYDFEVYSAAQKRWLEVSSVSNFESFQANRLKLRFREKNSKKMKLAHTLNGSALALPRIVAAILENRQTPKGIHVPEVLHKYTGFKIIN